MAHVRNDLHGLDVFIRFEESEPERLISRVTKRDAIECDMGSRLRRLTCYVLDVELMRRMAETMGESWPMLARLVSTDGTPIDFLGGRAEAAGRFQLDRWVEIPAAQTFVADLVFNYQPAEAST